jgi:hypothetical protein
MAKNFPFSAVSAVVIYFLSMSTADWVLLGSELVDLIWKLGVDVVRLWNKSLYSVIFLFASEEKFP